MKQLSEAFGAEAGAPEPAPPGAAGPAEEPARRSSPPAGQGAQRPPSPSTARPGRPAGHGFSSGKCSLRGDRAPCARDGCEQIGGALGTIWLGGLLQACSRQSLSLPPSPAVSHRLEPLQPGHHSRNSYRTDFCPELRICFQPGFEIKRYMTALPLSEMGL